MASIWIHEFASQPAVNGPLDAASLEPIAKQKVAFGADSTALDERTTYVRLWTDADAVFKYAADPSGVGQTDVPLAAKVGEYFGVMHPKLKIRAIALN